MANIARRLLRWDSLDYRQELSKEVYHIDTWIWTFYFENCSPPLHWHSHLAINPVWVLKLLDSFSVPWPYPLQMVPVPEPFLFYWNANSKEAGLLFPWSRIVPCTYCAPYKYRWKEFGITRHSGWPVLAWDVFFLEVLADVSIIEKIFLFPCFLEI